MAGIVLTMEREMSSFTIEKLYEAMRLVREIEDRTPMAFGPTQIIQSAYCLKDTTERLFPTSKNRSKRIHKKLVKRHGGEFRKQPAVFRTKDGLICHPELYHQMLNASIS